MTLFEEREFPAVLNELHNMLHFVKQAGVQCSLSQEKLLKLELACEEILMNIISHAYPADSSGTVHLSFTQGPDHFKVIIKDRGMIFDPTKAPLPNPIHQPIEQRKLGGLGILLARHSVDLMEYEHASPYNILYLTLKKD